MSLYIKPKYVETKKVVYRVFAGIQIDPNTVFSNNSRKSLTARTMVKLWPQGHRFRLGRLIFFITDPKIHSSQIYISFCKILLYELLITTFIFFAVSFDLCNLKQVTKRLKIMYMESLHQYQSIPNPFSFYQNSFMLWS